MSQQKVVFYDVAPFTEGDQVWHYQRHHEAGVVNALRVNHPTLLYVSKPAFEEVLQHYPMHLYGVTVILVNGKIVQAMRPFEFVVVVNRQSVGEADLAQIRSQWISSRIAEGKKSFGAAGTTMRHNYKGAVVVTGLTRASEEQFGEMAASLSGYLRQRC